MLHTSVLAAGREGLQTGSIAEFCFRLFFLFSTEIVQEQTALEEAPVPTLLLSSPLAALYANLFLVANRTELIYRKKNS